ncbi:MAG: hypothetical protein HDS53_00505 [Barnesiella sp.]|nr:hypothetical protein [Barnesiella sp.]
MAEKRSDQMINDQKTRLLRRLSEMFCRPLETSVDYQFLAEAISLRLGEYISPTTLKRIGGYLNESVSTRRTTLDLLSRAIGYQSFSDFCERESECERDSDPSSGHWLDVSEMKPGGQVELNWFPNRWCLIRFVGGDLWEIIESKETRLKAGQQFRCAHIIEGEPLQILLEPSNMIAKRTPYVCGKQRGIRYIRK